MIQQRHIAPSSPHWQWPIDPLKYDQTPVLINEERTKLARFMQRWSTMHVHWDVECKQDLPRLFCPLHDVLNVTRAEKVIVNATLRVFVREMNQRQTSFWAWTHDDWVAILGTSAEAFVRYHGFGSADESRQQVIAVAYLLRCFTDIPSLGNLIHSLLANKIFGKEIIERAVERVSSELQCWGYGTKKPTPNLRSAISLAFLRNGSPHLEDLSTGLLHMLHQESQVYYMRSNLFRLARALAHMKIIEKPLAYHSKSVNPETLSDVPPSWAVWAKRWQETSTLSPVTRERNYYGLLKVGRWLAVTHSEITTPEQWTRDLATEYVAVVDKLKVGDFSHPGSMYAKKIGKPYSPRAKEHQLGLVRTFFLDGQEWGWFPRCFDPRRSLATPRAVRALIFPDPRIIDDDIWAKLLWAGLNLAKEDLPAACYHSNSGDEKRSWYPLAMMQALVVTWLFAGLRLDEIRRLRVGCVRWQREDVPVLGTDDFLSKDAVCWLDIPVNKTGAAFTKAVDPLVGKTIEAWEKVRPSQPAFTDRKNGEIVHFLFAYRGRLLGDSYLNDAIIPLLCRKAGVPEADARGDITSHRARSTIASQLYNAKEPLTLFDLKEWLGHRELSSTQAYAKKSPTKVAKAYEKAGYFGRNIRAVEVLIDQDAVKSGVVTTGEPWRFYDLGHGYCQYEFFDQCPHRMACAKCSFYLPKGSSQAQLLEGKANLLHMLQQIPLSDEERAAVEDGIAAMEKLCQQLADIPTPTGVTPNQLGTGCQNSSAVISIKQVQKKLLR